MTDHDRFRELLAAALEQSRRGETVDLGDLTAYLTEEPPADATMAEQLQRLMDLDAYLDDQAIGITSAQPGTDTPPEHHREHRHRS